MKLLLLHYLVKMLLCTICRFLHLRMSPHLHAYSRGGYHNNDSSSNYGFDSNHSSSYCGSTYNRPNSAIFRQLLLQKFDALVNCGRNSMQWKLNKHGVVKHPQVISSQKKENEEKYGGSTSQNSPLRGQQRQSDPPICLF